MKKYVFIIICLLMCLCHIKAQETEKDSKFKLSFSERVRLSAEIGRASCRERV